MPRLKKKKSALLPPLEAGREDVRFGTPLEVADYRAERLKCCRIVEIGASVGFQTYSFAHKCRKVLAIEINNRKFHLLEKNMSQFSNVQLVCGDALSDDVLKTVRKFKPDIVFADTERPENENKRSLKNVKPCIPDILEKYGLITDKISVEVPPQTRRINFDCEKEYISLYNQLNRLTLYFGALKKCDARVVFLPQGNAVEGKEKRIKYSLKADANFIYEVNPAVTRAGLLYKFLKILNAKAVKAGSKVILFSNTLKHHFAVKPYRVVRKSRTAIPLGSPGDIVLKGSVRPEDYNVLKKAFGAGTGKTGMQRKDGVRYAKKKTIGATRIHAKYVVFVTDFGFFICRKI